ncbi:unnamed protein product [Rangifer tarandus platyrhynchus]|uniref:Uncharacterized protein n=1 Tax=Rangifer tarandus platyrhynchus TaxID=3082113 RepID=A0AC59ZX78_RANTA
MMWSEAQEEQVRGCLLLAASGGVAGEDEASGVLWLEVESRSSGRGPNSLPRGLPGSLPPHAWHSLSQTLQPHGAPSSLAFQHLSSVEEESASFWFSS